MKQKPPYYTLDTETRRFAELVVYWARQLESVQQPPNQSDMRSVIETVEARLGLLPPDDAQPQGPADVVRLRRFHVVTDHASNPQNESR